MPFDDQRILVSPTGASLNLYHAPGRGSGRAVVQVNHGLAEHAARYARFADFLAARGFHVYAHDHRGHGATTAPDAPHGIFGKPDGGAKVIADVAAVHDLIADGASRPAGDRLRPFDGRADRAEFRAPPFGRRRMPPRSGTPIFPPGFSGPRRAGDPCLGTIPPRLRRALAPACPTDLPGLGQADSEPPHRIRLAVARPGRGRQIRRRSALRLGCLGVAVAGRVPLRLLWRRRPQLFRRPQGPSLQPCRRRKRPGDRRRQGSHPSQRA